MTLLPSPRLLPSPDLLLGVVDSLSVPVPHPVTVDVRSRFPLAYQDADDRQGAPLLRWLSLLWDQVGEVSDLRDRLDPPAGTSALVDPSAADDAWLPWVGQMFGFTFPSSMPPDAMRAAVRTATFQRGTVPTIIAVAKRYLKPHALVRVFAATPDQWSYTVQIYADQVVGMTYDELSMIYPTYPALAIPFGRYDDFTGQTDHLTAALLAEKPAGLGLTVVFTEGTYTDLTGEFPAYTDLSARFSTYDLMTSYSPEAP